MLERGLAPLLSVDEVTVRFRIGRSFLGRPAEYVTAVSGVSLSIGHGETLGLVGESGCGKTTLGRIATRLLDPSSGEVTFEGAKVTGIKGRKLSRFRSGVQMVFQDPYTSLNPRLSAKQIVSEPLRISGGQDRADADSRAYELLEATGIAAAHVDRLPTAFSGGQRQRIAIARALALRPKLVVCDEPVSALDMSIQARILNLLAGLKEDYGLAYLFISHDLSVVRLMADRVAVMYLGKIVESGPTESVFDDPFHPYTRALIAAVPDPYDRHHPSSLVGEVPGVVERSSGCAFSPRCPQRMDICDESPPDLRDGGDGRRIACFAHDQSRAVSTPVFVELPTSAESRLGRRPPLNGTRDAAT